MAFIISCTSSFFHLPVPLPCINLKTINQLCLPQPEHRMCSPLHVLQTLVAVSQSAASSCFLQGEGGSTSGCFASCKSYQAQAFYITKSTIGTAQAHFLQSWLWVLTKWQHSGPSHSPMSLVFHTVMEWDSNHKDCGAWKLYTEDIDVRISETN